MGAVIVSNRDFSLLLIAFSFTLAAERKKNDDNALNVCAFVVITIVSENLHIKEIAISTKISKPFRQISPTNKSTHTKIRNHLRKKEREETRKHNVLRKYQINVNWQSPSKAWLQLLCTPNLVIKWDFCCCCYFSQQSFEWERKNADAARITFVKQCQTYWEI